MTRPDFIRSNLSVEEVENLRARLSASEARAEKAEERLTVAIDWIEGIPCLGRPGLLEDKQAILAALKKGGE